MSTTVGAICPAIWAALTQLAKAGLPGPFPTTPPANPGSKDDTLGHDGGVDQDTRQGSTGAQEAGAAASQEGSESGPDENVKPCPNCRVAIVVGHSRTSQGADSKLLGQPEWTYNNDIADRTVTHIASLSGGKVEAKVFYRVTGGDYTKEMATVYGQVREFLANVPDGKRISIELHYNSSTSATPRYAEILYKGDVAFAQKGAAKLAEIFGGTSRARHYTSNERGQNTFTNGPSNTYLMEPFFGSNPASAEIAKTAEAKDKLALAYATMLLEWAQ